GVPVVLAEVKRLKLGPAQKMTTDAELVCTNSLKSLQPDSSHGMLKHEMKGLGSLILKVGRETAVPAGDALAVDREVFSNRVTEKVSQKATPTFRPISHLLRKLMPMLMTR